MYNEMVHGKPQEVGTWVWLLNPQVPRGKSKKLHKRWTGPYKVVKKLSDVTYRIQHTSNRAKRVVVHFDRLKKCHPNTRVQKESIISTSPGVTDLPPAPNTSESPFGTTLHIIEDSDCAPGQGVDSSPTSPERSTSPEPNAGYPSEIPCSSKTSSRAF